MGFMLFSSSFGKLAIKLEMPVAKGDDHWEHQCSHMQCLSMILDSKEGVKLLASDLPAWVVNASQGCNTYFFMVLFHASDVSPQHGSSSQHMPGNHNWVGAAPNVPSPCLWELWARCKHRGHEAGTVLPGYFALNAIAY